MKSIFMAITLFALTATAETSGFSGPSIRINAGQIDAIATTSNRIDYLSGKSVKTITGVRTECLFIINQIKASGFDEAGIIINKDGNCQVAY